MTVAQRKPRALVLDDQYLVASSIEACLADLGFEATVALSEADALAALTLPPFDIAIVDYHLAAGTSDAVAARLDELGTPYALCSGSTAEEVLEHRPDATVITKPFSESELIGAIAKLAGTSPALL
ncbi:MAG TPA: hypothetical protein PK286_12170 [Devosia sp.]|nr:hypothetical protein [Devosia sp.]